VRDESGKLVRSNDVGAPVPPPTSGGVVLGPVEAPSLACGRRHAGVPYFGNDETNPVLINDAARDAVRAAGRVAATPGCQIGYLERTILAVINCCFDLYKITW
jgi:hypothetical protein